MDKATSTPCSCKLALNKVVVIHCDWDRQLWELPFQSNNQTSIAPISLAKPGSVARLMTCYVFHFMMSENYQLDPHQTFHTLLAHPKEDTESETPFSDIVTLESRSVALELGAHNPRNSETVVSVFPEVI